MNKDLIIFLLRIVLFIIKTGQVKNALSLVVLVVRAKLSYDEAWDRMTGKYYERQVQMATDKYKNEHPDDFRCDTSGVEGFDKWKRETQ